VGFFLHALLVREERSPRSTCERRKKPTLYLGEKKEAHVLLVREERNPRSTCERRKKPTLYFSQVERGLLSSLPSRTWASFFSPK
jgi:hypothetical protein